MGGEQSEIGNSFAGEIRLIWRNAVVVTRHHSGVPSEDSAQFEEHPLMPGRSDRPTQLNRPKYRIDYKCGNDIARCL
jgi:hypothetical protein